MEALTLSRETLQKALNKVDEGLGSESYISLFSCTFPDGINTANVLDICRVLQSPTMENKLKLMKICIQGKNVEIKCPNGEIEKFCMMNIDDNLEAFPLFEKDPLSLIALMDSIYGYVLGKSVRLSKAQEAAANKME